MRFRLGAVILRAAYICSLDSRKDTPWVLLREINNPMALHYEVAYTVDDIHPALPLRSLNYGNYGTFLIMYG